MPSGKPCTAKQLDAATHKLHVLASTYKQKPSGASAAFDYLKGCSTDAEAYAKVRAAYQSYYGLTQFEHVAYDGRKFTRSCYGMLFEQAYLLWMQRGDDRADVMNFMNELGVSNG